MSDRRAVVVGGSIAAVTAAVTLRARGYDGEVIMVSNESIPPYSRVPLSKGVLAGTEAPDSAFLPAVPDDIDLRLGVEGAGLDVAARRLELTDGRTLRFEELVIATGARPRRLARPGQRGEVVLRELGDASVLAERAARSATAIVVGGGFLGMEIASTLLKLGLAVTVVAVGPPLHRHLGQWLAHYVVERARAAGVEVISVRSAVALVGDPVSGVDAGEHGTLHADLIVTAIGDEPNVEWLAGCGLPLAGGVVCQPDGYVAPGISAAGDVASRVVEGTARRFPHWTNAVEQATYTAQRIVDPATPARSLGQYYWTTQFGLDVKISGRLPAAGEPTVLEGDPDADSALLQWTHGDGRSTAVSINHHLPIVRLKRVGELAPVAEHLGI